MCGSRPSARARRLDEAEKEWVRTIGTRLKLRVRLGADVERMISDLSELHESPVGRGAEQRMPRLRTVRVRELNS